MLLLLLCLSYAKAQEEFVAPQSHFITKLPFVQLSGGIIIIKALVDNSTDSLNFVFDTGSGGISLDSATARELQSDGSAAGTVGNAEHGHVAAV